MSSPRRPQPSAQLPSRLPAPPFQGVVCRWESAAKWNQWSVIERRPLHCPSCHPHHHPNVAAIRPTVRVPLTHGWNPTATLGQGLLPHMALNPNIHAIMKGVKQRGIKASGQQLPAAPPLWDVILGRGQHGEVARITRKGHHVPLETAHWGSDRMGTACHQIG